MNLMKKLKKIILDTDGKPYDLHLIDWLLVAYTFTLLDFYQKIQIGQQFRQENIVIMRERDWNL